MNNEKQELTNQISDWITNKFSLIFKIPYDQIDIHKNLADYGLDSINAIAVTGELEEIFEIELPSSLLWNYNTILKIAEYISSQKFDKS